MRLSAVGFVVHLSLIGLARVIPALREGVAGLDRNFLHAVYTPFSFILFYEVVLLVLAIPKSHTISIGKQYEIVSLIVIRRVFKDIGEFTDPFTDPAAWLTETDAAIAVLRDMGAALLMFLLVAAFYQLRQTVVHYRPDDNLEQFVSIKKMMAVLLCVLLLILAVLNFVQWLGGVFLSSTGGISAEMDLDLYFFPTFFEFMVFADVLLLILSLPFYERYEYVIRNAGFVISTVLVRFSLTSPKPYDLIAALVAMVYGLCVLAVFSYYTRVAVSDLTDPAESKLVEEGGERSLA